MDSPILRRILREVETRGVWDALVRDLPPSDLQSLLLAILRERARAQRENDLIERAGRDTLTTASEVDGRALQAFDRAAFKAAERFDAVELSPVCPLGTESVLAGIDPNNVLTTIRSAEVLGDSTPALALECGRRRRRPSDRPGRVVRLASSHRMIRLQSCDFPGFSMHFRLFALVTAGRDTGSRRFEMAHLTEHIRVYLDLFRLLNEAGFSLSAPLVEVADFVVTSGLLEAAGVKHEEVRAAVRAHIPGSGERFLAERGITLASGEAAGDEIRERVFEPLAHEYPETEFRFDAARLEGFGYYPGLCFRISLLAPDGERYPVADGGFTDWTARLLNDRKERLLTSGIGSEFVCRKYRR